MDSLGLDLQPHLAATGDARRGWPPRSRPAANQQRADLQPLSTCSTRRRMSCSAARRSRSWQVMLR